MIILVCVVHSVEHGEEGQFGYEIVSMVGQNNKMTDGHSIKGSNWGGSTYYFCNLPDSDLKILFLKFWGHILSGFAKKKKKKKGDFEIS